MKFKRCTHDEHGNAKENLPKLHDDGWISCCVHMVDSEWQSLDRIYKAHIAYDKQYGSLDGFNYSIADVLSGLSYLIRLGLVEAKKERNNTLEVCVNCKYFRVIYKNPDLIGLCDNVQAYKVAHPYPKIYTLIGGVLVVKEYNHCNLFSEKHETTSRFEQIHT